MKTEVIFLWDVPNILAVVHRLDIIKNFNKIGVLKSGKVEEMGSYDELMAKKGLLYELVGAKR